MELDRKSSQTSEINLLNLANDEKQNENRAADQFFSSLLEADTTICRSSFPDEDDLYDS